MTSWSEKHFVAFEVVTILSKPVTGVNRMLVTSAFWVTDLQAGHFWPRAASWRTLVCVTGMIISYLWNNNIFRHSILDQGSVYKWRPWATNAFYIFKWLNKRSVLFRDAWKRHGIHISLSINEVLLAHSHAHWFILCELLLRSSGRRVWEWWPQSLTHLLSGSWQKQLADLLDHYLIQGRTHARLTGSTWRWL